MNDQEISNALENLRVYCENEDFKGYDPYDTLNSFIPFSISNYFAAVAIQIQKRNPINIRPLLGVKKGINPKGFGLFLKAYSLLYRKTGDKIYQEKAEKIFQWLNENYTRGFSGKCWGYNFDWASPGSFLKVNTPSVVVTSFVIDGIFEYYKISNDQRAVNCILSAADYIVRDIPLLQFEKGLAFSYTHLSGGACYNASLLASEILAKANCFQNNTDNLSLIRSAMEFVLSKQKTNGCWFYSYNPETNTERKQIDFHQGFILVSLQNLIDHTGILWDQVKSAIERGLHFYKNEQFSSDGRSMWRLPRKWPVDIHNQSQGIITFSRLSSYNDDYLAFARIIASWTINHMQSTKGYFFYRKTPLFTNKISYMRWSQAWMMLALTELLEE